ncbi:MAG: hypothetical protein IKL48_06655 [Elusimicrobiaceae bacterium]|nr:hypothetical protein [Elusimicrobiaceae bacterium]
MKKIFCLTVLSAVAFASGCATTGANTEASTANKTLTLEEALQKSAETRQKLLDAKQAYENAKAAVTASQTNDTDIATELAKQAIESKINDAKNQIEAEKEAWKEIFAD